MAPAPLPTWPNSGGGGGSAIDTSRVALALARARIMGARYPYYILADSRDGQLKEAEISRRAPSEMPAYGNVQQGFVYDRVPHITLRDIANNAEIDVIYEEYQEKLEPVREAMNQALSDRVGGVVRFPGNRATHGPSRLQRYGSLLRTRAITDAG